MKYYYNNQLIRTSKNHKYTHAVIERNEDGSFGCIACSSSEDGARKSKQKEAGYYERRIRNYEAAIKALKDGKSGYYWKDGRHTDFVKFDKERTVEHYEDLIKQDQKSLDRIHSWEIVPIEER